MKKMPRVWSDAVLWLGYNLAGMMIPVGIGMLVVGAMKLTFSVSAVTQGGQFAVYSAAMSIAIMYLIAKPHPKRLPFGEVFGLVCFLTFAVAVALFVLAILYSNGVDVAIRFVEWPSICLFGVCVGVTFFAVVFDNRRIQMGRKDLYGMKQSRLDSLDEEFDNMG